MPSLCRDCFEIFYDNLEKCPNCQSRRIVHHKKINELAIAHIDCDAYFAALHKRDDPSLRNIPILVGGGHRGVVSTACYIARSYGIKSAMPMFQALKLCPHVKVIRPDMKLYQENSRALRLLFDELSPAVDFVSIDEAYIDLSGTEKLHGLTPAQSLAKLANRIEKEIGITISIGLSENKFLAKTASDIDKPRGFFILAKDDVKDVLWPREVGFLHGVGKQTAKRLQNMGFATVKDIATADKNYLLKKLGDTGEWLYNIANGNDRRMIGNEHIRKSISTETTFFNDIIDTNELVDVLKNLCQKIARTARAKSTKAKTITVKLKTAKFKTITRQTTVPEPTQTAKTIFETAKPLLLNEISKGPFRLIGIGLSDLYDETDAVEADLFAKDDKHLNLERAMDKISDKFGKNIFKKF